MQDAAREAQTDRRGGAAAPEHLILLADDEAPHRRAVERILRHEGDVVSVPSGADALSVLSCRPVSLLIADQRMPGMKGTELLARAARCHPRVVRVLLTAYADVPSLESAVNEGRIHSFLSKPWRAAQLRLTVRRCLEHFDAETERLRLNRRLRDSCRAARNEADHKARLLAVLAHELGTPVHIVLNAAALLSEMELPAVAARWVDAVFRASRRLAMGVAQVHRVASLRRQPLRLRCAEVDLGAIVEQTVADLRRSLSGRELDVSVSLEGALPAIRADRRWLREALWNLLTNAVRCTPDGGRVEVDVARHAGAAVLSVCDNGIGVPVDATTELFEPFSGASGDVLLHASGWLAFGARGLGLGLALTREVAEAHRGRVCVEPREGGGSCFRIKIPLS
jgi:signal transduction histidine kinase